MPMREFVGRLEDGSQYVITADSIGHAFRILEERFPDDNVTGMREVIRGFLDRVVIARGLMFSDTITVTKIEKYPVFPGVAKLAQKIDAGTEVLISVGPDGMAHKITPSYEIKGYIRDLEVDSYTGEELVAE